MGTLNKKIQSIDEEFIFEDEEILLQRRISSYSPEALRSAKAIDEIYVNHPGFASAVAALDRIFQLAPELKMAQGMVLSGPAGTGKSSVFEYFRKTLPPSSLFATGYGAISIRCPQKSSTSYLIAALLRHFKYPFSNGSYKQLYARRQVVFEAIREKRTRILFLDEASGLMSHKTRKFEELKETEVTDFIREIIDECKIGIVLATKMSIKGVDEIDDALASRIPVRQVLDNFEPNGEWIGMMKAFCQKCPTFNLKLISDEQIAIKLHAASDGNLRAFKRLLGEAILVAFDAQKESIEEPDLAKAFQLVFGSAIGRPNVFQ